MLTRRAPPTRPAGPGACDACGATWSSTTARWCGACGAALDAATTPRRAPRGERMAVVATLGGLLAVAAVALVGVVLADRPPAVGSDAVAVNVPDGVPSTDPAVARPAGPDCLAAPGCVVWRYPLVTDDRSTATTVLEDDVVVALGGDEVHAVDVADGSARWRAEIRGAAPRVGYPTSFVVVGDLVLVQRHDRLTAFRLDDGEVAWSQHHDVLGVFTGHGSLDGDLVVVLDGVDDRGRTSVALGLDPATGEVGWRRDAVRAVVTPDGVLAADHAGFRAFDGEGRQRWEDPGPVPAEWSAAAVGDGTVLVTSAARTVLRSMRDGTLGDPLPGHLLAVDDTTAALAPAPRSGGAEERVVTLVSDGQVRWQVDEPDDGCCLSAALTDDHLLLLTTAGRVVTLDRDDGRVAARSSPLATPTREAVHLDGEVLVRQDPVTTTLHRVTGTAQVSLPRDRFPLLVDGSTAVVRDAAAVTLLDLGP